MSDDAFAQERRRYDRALLAGVTGWAGPLHAGEDRAIELALDLQVRGFQARSGLVPDGVIGPLTRSTLIADLAQLRSERWADAPPFLGSFGLIVQWEGYNPEPHFPGAKSGPTLHPGYDLREKTAGELLQLYGPLVGTDGAQRLADGIGLWGVAAKAFCAEPDVKRIRVDRYDGAALLPMIAEPYWRGLCARYKGLAEAPPRVQSALLSVAYNAGVGGAKGFRMPLHHRSPEAVADTIAALPWNRPRRYAEAEFVRGQGTHWEA